jgi:hypothetical protein
MSAMKNSLKSLATRMIALAAAFAAVSAFMNRWM